MNQKEIRSLFAAWGETMIQNKDYLIDLDSVSGDGDLGLTMSDGFSAASRAAAASVEKDLGKLVYQAGKAFGSAAPSSLGTLFAAGFMNAGIALGGIEEIDISGALKLISALAEGIVKLGKAKEGEKTVLDSLYPAIRAMKVKAAEGAGLKEALQEAAKAAEEGFYNTAKMVAKHGRIATRGEKSVEILDPGAAVAVLLMKTFALTVT